MLILDDSCRRVGSFVSQTSIAVLASMPTKVDITLQFFSVMRSDLHHQTQTIYHLTWRRRHLYSAARGLYVDTLPFDATSYLLSVFSPVTGRARFRGAEIFNGLSSESTGMFQIDVKYVHEYSYKHKKLWE